MNRRCLNQWIGGTAALVILTVWKIAAAQTDAPATGPSLAELQTRLKHAQAETELDPKIKQEVIETYQSAIERFELASEATTTAKAFLQRIDSVAEQLRQVKLKLAMPPEQPTISAIPIADIDELERKLEERRSLIDEPEHGLRAKVELFKKELSARKFRLEEITRNMTEVDERLNAIQELIDAPSPEQLPHELTTARQMLLQIRRMRANEERSALRAEQAWCESDAADEFLRVQRDLAARELAIVEADVKSLQTGVDQRRGNEADQRVRAAEQAVAAASPRIRPVAQANLKLAIDSREVAAALRETNQRIDSAQAGFNSLKAEFDQSRAMVEAVGLTEAIGLLLRQQRARLSDTRELHSRLTLRGEVVRNTKMRGFQIDADIAALQDLDAATTREAHELNGEEATTSATTLADDRANLRLADEIKPLLEQRRDLLDRLNTDYGTHFEKLVSLDNDERKLLDATHQYSGYIDERVLWIRTGTVFGGTQTAQAISCSKWLVDRANWLKVADALRINFQREPLPYAFAIVALLLWGGLRWTVLGRLRSLGVRAAGDSCHEMFPTLQAIGLTMLLGAVVPSVLAFVGSRLDHCASTSRFVHALAQGLLRAATFAAPLEMLRSMVCRNGLAENHFVWSAETLIRFRRHLLWFIPVGIVLVGLVGMVEATADEQRLDTLGRLGYLAFAGLLALFCYRALPRLPRVTPVAEQHRGSHDTRRSHDVPNADDVWMNRLARLGTFLAVTIPLGLVILCWSGYFYTALQLTWRLQASAWLAMGLVLLRGSIQRWIALERRHMAILQAEELAAIEGAGKHPGTDSHSPFLFPRWTWPDFRLNLTQIVTQVRSLLDTGLLTVAAVGLWFVWADVTPALNILDKVTLWQTTAEEVVSAKGTGADDKPVVQVVRRPKDITAAHLGLAILIMAIATIAGRNIPGLVEVILLEHLSVDAGIRFATTCLVRHAIFITGVALAFNQIGIGWNSVQWLVAAASVGLGFGLQEIFANFVSGIILLFERPMRVGDVITIGDTTGTVSRIRFRATTIVDGDRKELIVPNKSFITGNLLNWTLSDSINRVAVKVAVAYGSNPQQVREILLKIASEHPSLLKDPAPSASLEELGDSALIFQLRAFLPNLKDRQKATHELNARIHDAFRIAGIETPLPQYEVSINHRNQPSLRNEPINDLNTPLEIALQRAGVNL